MKRVVVKDPYFDKQPPMSFIEKLKQPLFSEKPEYYGKRTVESGEVDARGMYLHTLYPDDPEDLLKTSYDDIKTFLKVYEIDGDRYPIIIRKGKTECFEAYTIEITAESIVITADDTEGVRRALIYIEDELRRQENAFLTPGVIARTPKIRTRITHCFFAPTNREPKFEDELNDDIDYYPEEYLNRLMHDGVNGIWIEGSFGDILPSSIIPEYGKNCRKRVAKMNRVIAKCRRYGIGIYLFSIDPIHLSGEMAKKYPDIGGSTIWDGDPAMTFCVNTEKGRAYCYEAGQRMMELMPGLAGFINITFGERVTHCSCLPAWYFENKCPRCKDKNQGEVVADVAEALRSGIRDTKPQCEVVSWTYQGSEWSEGELREYVKHAPDDVMLMQNFEDSGYEEQLGRLRQCSDYWLSYVGPSQKFRIVADQAKKSGKHLFAKMQVCCSHELASVPYIPAPVNLYRKYKTAYELGVEGVMQCWFFGNYPSLMSKAAGELSFFDYTDETQFLTALAAVYWGRTKAPEVVKAWKFFSESYAQYPMNIMFSYFGPMHDSVVWKLALKPKNFSLGRTWMGDDPADGDRIGECLYYGHTLDEAVILLNHMCTDWSQGLQILSGIPIENEAEEEQYTVAAALQCLFVSARNILTFYQTREKLGKQLGNPAELLQKMRELVMAEMENSRVMIALCGKDSRLGYHSEAEVYKFFPEKIEDRIAQLTELLDTEFAEVEERIRNGKTPLEYYDGVEDNDDVARYTMVRGTLENAEWTDIDSGYQSKFRMAYDASHVYFELYCDEKTVVTITPEFNLMHPGASVLFYANNTMGLVYNAKRHLSVFGETEEAEYARYQNRYISSGDETHIRITFDRKDIGLEVMRPFRMHINAGGSWSKGAGTGSQDFRPGADIFGWILPQ